MYLMYVCVYNMCVCVCVCVHIAQTWLVAMPLLLLSGPPFFSLGLKKSLVSLNCGTEILVLRWATLCTDIKSS